MEVDLVRSGVAQEMGFVWIVSFCVCLGERKFIFLHVRVIKKSAAHGLIQARLDLWPRESKFDPIQR